MDKAPQKGGQKEKGTSWVTMAITLIRGSLSEFQSHRKLVAFCPKAGAVHLRFEPQDGGKAM